MKEAKELFELHRRIISPLNPNFHVHFTPSYVRIHERLPVPDPNHPHKGPYKYMNKPYVENDEVVSSLLFYCDSRRSFFLFVSL